MQNDVVVIKVNNIEVGSMPKLQYEEIVKSVKEDWRTKVSSVFSYVGFIWKIINRLWSYFVQSFAVLIALFMIYSIFNFAEVAQLVNELRNASSDSIAKYIVLVANISILLTITGCVISFFIQGYPLFVSASENAINKKVREVMEVPTEGQVSITFIKGGNDANK
ncbi:hypothetical protein NOM68_06555 [Proteus mirabilis]|uniref:hypothetical protein n=1 Tax=Proteus mirabilis TaxID=584 RepID=UPI00217E3051|nr:hypothetical protein [Proteus mirabilis]MCS6721222.1 hypothetical protein [Proteus mirabilis]MCS6727929.1 hypothetical protein [Proteus mirabilis]MCS6736785.1 hypothetical protein [Proteus mirabilis]MCS6741701.1 hypothetical protein [Acinetobacter baumannii]